MLYCTIGPGGPGGPGLPLAQSHSTSSTVGSRSRGHWDRYTLKCDTNADTKWLKRAETTSPHSPSHHPVKEKREKNIYHYTLIPSLCKLHFKLHFTTSLSRCYYIFSVGHNNIK